MAGDSLNPTPSRRVVTAISSEQFLYSLARTPRAARFQRPRSNCQILPDLDNPVRADGITNSASRRHQDATSPPDASRPHDSTSSDGFEFGDPKSEPPRKTPVAEIGRDFDDEVWFTNESNKPQNFKSNTPGANSQRLAPVVESRSTLRAAQLPTQTKGGITNESSSKRAVGITASKIYSIALSPSPPVTHAASDEAGESDTQSNLGFESGYDSNDSSEGSGSLYTDSNIHLNNSDESDHAAAQSTEAYIRKSPPSQHNESPIIDERESDRVSRGPSKKKLKRPTRFGSETLAQNVTSRAMEGEIAEKTVSGQMCRTLGQLQLAEENRVERDISESGGPFSDDSSIIQSQHILPETPRLSIRQKRFPETSPQKPRKKSKKTYPNTKMMSSKIHFKGLRLTNRASVPPDCPKPIPTRLDFCDGFVGEESQPIGRTKAAARPRRLPPPGVLRRSQGYSCQLSLVQSRNFGDEPSLQEKGENPSIPITFQSNQRGGLITMNSERKVSKGDSGKEDNNQKNLNSNAGEIGLILGKPTVRKTKPADQVSDANPETIINHEISSMVEDIDMAVASSPRSEKFDNCSSFSGSPVLDGSPAGSRFKRRVTFNEDVEVIRQQLSMVSAPPPTSMEDSDDETDGDDINEDEYYCNNMDDDEAGEDESDGDRIDEDELYCNNMDDEEEEEDEDTPNKESDNQASRNDGEVDSSEGENSIEPSSPLSDRRSLDTTLPSTPTHRLAVTEVSDFSDGSGAETDMLDDEMILDDAASIIFDGYHISDLMQVRDDNRGDEKLNQSPSCPWAPRRSALPRYGIETGGDVCASPPPKALRKKKKTFNDISLNQGQMDWSPTQPTTPIPRIKGHRRGPSIELGNAAWPPRSFYPSFASESQATTMVGFNHQFKQFMVADVPSYFTVASQSVIKPPATVGPMRSKSMPSRSQYFKIEQEEQNWEADENILSNFASASKVTPYMGSQDERDTSLRALTRHISIGFGTPGERRLGDPTFQINMVRLKNRYLLVNILYPESAALPSSKVPDVVAFNQPTTDDLTPQLLIKAIREAVLELFGDYGSGAIAGSLMVKYLSPATSTFIIRVTRAHYRIAWAALSMMNTVPVKDGKKCVYRVVRVSGTIRKAEEEAIRRAREIMLRAKRELGEQSAATLESILGKPKDNRPVALDSEVLMLDASDDDMMGYSSDDDG
ncbi:hypothetical protein V490_06350 [Pseudogymnoascus sp. VKM F-3557]|nr:hypothetical protein V490_06350 [Pseudogymnoascus sp. VKM F-3557]